MRAIQLTNSNLVEDDIPQPRPGRGEILIRVYAAGVTPTELIWYPTNYTKTGEKRSLAVPGHEFSGVVAALGETVEGFAVSQEVYGMNDWFAEGAMAEYCVTTPSSIAAKPGGLSHVQAATVPIGALTAWQGLYDRAKVQAGERVLVHGGAGAVGIYAIQLARLRGARVLTTVSPRNREFVLELGAEEAIDYTSTRFEDGVNEVDVVFDTVGGETLERSWAVLKPGGRMITIAANAEGNREERVKQAFFIVEPDQQQLIEVGEMLAAGRLQTFVDAVVPLAQAPAAFASQVKERRGRGKLVVAIAAAGSSVA